MQKLLFALSSLSLVVSAQAVITVGDIAFVGFNADGNDGVAFVALNDIAADSILHFNDNEWTGAAFNTGEGSFSWTSPSTILNAGTVVVLDGISSTTLRTANFGTLSGGTVALGNSNETLFAFTGVDASTASAFVSVIANDFVGTSVDNTLSGTGLTFGVNAIDFANDLDVYRYNGPRSGETSFAAYASLIYNTANWTTADGSGDQSGNVAWGDATVFTTVAVPEPSTAAALAGLAVLGLVALRRRA